MPFHELISQAGRQRKTVKLRLKTTHADMSAASAEFEPYSSREMGGKTTFFCLDIAQCACMNIDLAAVLDVEITTRSFKPRFPISF